MISNEQGRRCGHVTLVGIRDKLGVSRQRVRITIYKLQIAFSHSSLSSVFET